MKKELDNIIIEYNTCDTDYIELVSESLQKDLKEILNFFDLEKLRPKPIVRLWPDLEKFRNVFSLENLNIVGLRQKEKNVIHILSLRELQKTKNYKRASETELTNIILHELVHECHTRYTTKKCYIWLWEGLATFLSNQYLREKSFHSTLNQMKTRESTDYQEYYTMFSYVYKTYGKEYILELLNNFSLQEKETPRLHQETKEHIKE